MSDIRVSFFDAIGEYGGDAFDAKKVITGLCIATCATSVVCAIILVDITTGWDTKYFSFQRDNKFFYHHTADSLYIAIGQCVVLPAIAWCGINSASLRSKSASQKCCECFRCFYSAEEKRYITAQAQFLQHIG